MFRGAEIACVAGPGFNRMNIAIIAHVKFPIAEPFAGGLEMHTHQLAAGLRHRGHHVVVFAATRSDPALNTEAICDQTELDAVGVEEAPDHIFFREHHAYLSLMGILRRRNFDIVHNNSLHYLPVAMADSLPMPMVTTLHTPPFAWLESGIRLCRSAASRFVAVSQSTRDAWSSIMPVHRVIRNGIDLKRFAYRPQPDASPYVAWSGRIVPEKGLHLAIDAAVMARMDLRIAGPISDPSYFEAEIAPRLGSHTQYLGHLRHVDLAAMVAGARAALCTPCWEEPFGLVVAEALACGVPVAAFDRGAMPELLTPLCGALAPPGDVVSLASALRRAVTLARAACRRRALECWDLNRMVDTYETLYKIMLMDRQSA